MKKISIIFLLASFSFVAKSQKSYFGVDAGINVANQRVTYPPYTVNVQTGTFYYDNTIRPSFSIFYHYNVSDAIGLRANVRYMGLGYNLPQTNNSFTYIANYNINVNYLTIPLSIHYSANKHLSLNAGTYVSFTLGGNDFNNQDVTKTFHKNDFGFSLGGEHDLYKNFAIAVTYFIGAKNIWLNDQGGLFGHTNRALQIALIYKFKKAKLTTNN